MNMKVMIPFGNKHLGTQLVSFLLYRLWEMHLISYCYHTMMENNSWQLVSNYHQLDNSLNSARISFSFLGQQIAIFLIMDGSFCIILILDR